MLEEVVFDIEVFPEWWCLVYTTPNKMDELNVLTNETPNYKNIIMNLIIKRCLIGFNIKKYDMRILNAIIHNCDPARIYQLSKDIIEKDDEIPSTDPFNNYTFWNKFNFSDLIDDFVGKGSLKEFESNIGMSILESEVAFDTYDLTDEQKADIIKYCKHDVKATVKLLEHRREYIDSKKTLSVMFNMSMAAALKSTNAKLCATILKAVPQKRRLEDTFVIPDKVAPYVNSNLPSSVVDLFNIIDKESKEVYLFNNLITFGVGGIHSTYSENIVCKTDDKESLINIDVTSYYPNLMMIFGYMSRNVPDGSLYKQIYDLRVDLKQQASLEMKTNGKTEKWADLNARQNALKLILNTTYGAIKNKYNALYDEYQASCLCYLGQLLLAALANKLYNEIGCKIIQTNTDGILIKVDNNKINDVKEIVSEWETLTGMNMEYDYIKMFFQRDVNNYIEVTDNPRKPYKLKGKWTNQAEESIANLNAPITHEAILEYYVNNTPVEDTINKCDNIFKFCFTAKAGRTYNKTYHYINDEPRNCNKINRVVATTDTRYGTLKKYKVTEDGKPRFDKIADVPEHCILMNDELYMIDTLDREWYVAFANNKLKELRWV